MQKTQLALFPLQLFLLPGETTQLHIFEDRYRQLLADCEDVHIPFGIPYTESGTITGHGCLVQLKRVIKRHPNGSADIEIEATGIFKVKRFFLRMGQKPYPGGDVAVIDQGEFSHVGNELFAAFNTYMDKIGRVITPESYSAELNILDLARMLALEASKKGTLLKLKTPAKREKLLLDEIKLRLLLLKQKGSAEGNIFLN